MFVRAIGGALPFLVLAQQQQRMLASPLEWHAFLVAHLVLVIAYFGVTEGLWSASPGKMIVGLRVVSTGRQPIGLKRSLARAFLLSLSVAPAGAVWIALWPFELGVAAWRASLPSYLASAGAAFTGLGILYSRARRANGFAGLHELATDTRVVLKPPVESPSAHSSALSSPPVLPAALTRLGPYVVLDETAAPGVAVGFDQQLARRVWIRHAPAGTPAVSLGRRSVSRPTRLRWLTGWRDAEDGWDAYEAADGEPLRSTTRRPRSWATVRTWLRDLAQEITAAEEDRTLLPLDLERIWISGGRARLLDWRLDGVQGPGELPESMNSRDVHRVQHFLHDVAVVGLRIGEASLNRSADPVGLPLHAREFLDDLASKRFDTTAAIVERLRSLATRPVTVTRPRRCAHLALSGAAPLMGVLLFVPALTVLLPLLAESPDAFALDACLRRLERLEQSSSPDAIRERAAVETYVVGRFRPLLTAQPTSKRPWFWPLIEIRQSAVQRALARQPNPSGEDIERAAQQLAGLVSAAQRDRELASRRLSSGGGWRSPGSCWLSPVLRRSGCCRRSSRGVARSFDCSALPSWGQAGREVSRSPSRRPRADRVGPWHCRASAPPAIWHFAIGGRSICRAAESLARAARGVRGQRHGCPVQRAARRGGSNRANLTRRPLTHLQPAPGPFFPRTLFLEVTAEMHSWERGRHHAPERADVSNGLDT